MSTQALAAILAVRPVAATVLPNRAFTARLPSVILQKILAFANTVTLAATSKDFKEATEALIKREWQRLDLNLYPNIKIALAPHPPLAFQKPTSCRDLQTIYDSIHQKCTGEGNTSLAIRARNQIKGSFSPSGLQKLEDAAKQAESNRNLELIWPTIVKTLPPALNLRLDMNSAQIKHWLNTNSNQLAPTQWLNLSDLNLTMIPEEFSSLDLPNLRSLSLQFNRLTTLPAKFGNKWTRLQHLFLNGNRIRVLPDNFGNNWIHLQILFLQSNQIRTLPPDFGANWAWWLQDRNTSLAENPILAPPPAIVPPAPAMIVRSTPPAIVQPDPVIVQPIPPPIVPRAAPASPYQKLQKALISRTTVHVLSTIALTAIASYAVGWKLAGTMGAIYLTHRFRSVM